MKYIVVCLMLLLASSVLADASWPFQDIFWSGATDSFLVKQFSDGRQVGSTERNITGAKSYAATRTAQSGALNQAVIYIYFTGFSHPAGWGFDWDLNTVYSSESLWTHEAYWPGVIDSLRWRWRQDGSQIQTGRAGRVYSFDSAFACATGKYNRLSLQLYYPGFSSPTTWEFIRDLVDTAITAIQAPSPNACLVYGYLYSIDNRPLQNALVTFSLTTQANDTCNDVIVGSFTASCRTDVNGYFSKGLLYSSCLGGATYQVTIKKGSETPREKKITVPSATSYELIW